MATPKPQKRSLTDFLATRPKPERDCVVCKLPQADEINGTRKGRRPFTKCEDIVDWLLSDQGMKPGTVTAKVIQTHFLGRHHEAA